MRIHDVDWPRGIRDKVRARHGLEPEQVEGALLGERTYIRRTRDGKYFGRSDDGAYIISVVVYKAGIARVISARVMTAAERRTYQRSGK